MQMVNYQFVPNSLEVSAGQTVRLEVTTDGLAHTFTVRDLGIDVPLAIGPRSRSIAFQVPAGVSGDFPLVCLIHEFYDMVGTVRVR